MRSAPSRNVCRCQRRTAPWACFSRDASVRQCAYSGAILGELYSLCVSGGGFLADGVSVFKLVHSTEVLQVFLLFDVQSAGF